MLNESPSVGFHSEDIRRIIENHSEKKQNSTKPSSNRVILQGLWAPQTLAGEQRRCRGHAAAHRFRAALGGCCGGGSGRGTAGGDSRWTLGSNLAPQGASKMWQVAELLSFNEIWLECCGDQRDCHEVWSATQQRGRSGLG